MKTKIIKAVFILSFIPYVLAVVFTLFIICEKGIETKQLLRLSEDIFESFLVIPIIPACVTFQMCYIFRKKRKAMFVCSFIPCVFVLLVILKYMIFGINILGDTVYYGLDAFSVGLFGIFIYYVVYFPILPVCLFFQIVLITLKLKNNKAENKLANT
ncbi:MAG: hypothetical protein UD936_03255 [Acutalibacteraceae bacterium]|nr:hypothetical protein [Acutalibacteraceae bacterium]